MNRRLLLGLAVATLSAVPGWSGVISHSLEITTYYNDSLCFTNTLWTCSDPWDASVVTASPNSNNTAFVRVVTAAEPLGGGADGSLAYTLDVSGPGASATVDVDANLQTGYDPATGAAGSARIAIQQGSLLFLEKQVSSGASFEGTLSLSLPVGAYVVWLDAGASTGSNGGTFAYADPHIYIDPGFASANPGYSVDTDGVGNQVGTFSAAPEPGTFALTGALLAIAVIIRRRRTPRRG